MWTMCCSPSPVVRLFLLLLLEMSTIPTRAREIQRQPHQQHRSQSRWNAKSKFLCCGTACLPASWLACLLLRLQIFSTFRDDALDLQNCETQIQREVTAAISFLFFMTPWVSMHYSLQFIAVRFSLLSYLGHCLCLSIVFLSFRCGAG